MTSPVHETLSPPQPFNPSRRRAEDGDCLVLSELNPRMVIDHLEDEAQPLQLQTFGTVRETCPKCQSGHLKLVLRQSAVRMAHLFCADCASCFDAHYPDGKPALTI
ncbi:hypothetical protein [uncultured Massilia sp.]|uniref:hypothetical protein n=1 Tax=uncultured Massilia sp. TaxID=169973 RepID=UPI0025D029D2|nr:hypothetical protein [uncultured Massilia sp.]